MPQQPQDPFAEFVVGDDPFAAFVEQQEEIEAPPKEELSSGGATALTGSAALAPGVVKGVARFAANHPSGTQKVIGAGVSSVAGSIGAGVAGVPGAVIGASIRGVTPTQAAIRETAGRLAGEAPEVAKTAGRAQGVINYAKEVPGLRVNPASLISTGNATRALDSYADSNGLKVVRILGPDGKVVIGPEAATQVARKAPGIVRKAVGAVASPLAKVMGPLSILTGATDFAQAVEPTRQDIGVAGIGASRPDPTAEELTSIDARNKAEMESRLKNEDQQRADLIQRILQSVGLR